jgi:hypothetical protein
VAAIGRLSWVPTPRVVVNLSNSEFFINARLRGIEVSRKIHEAEELAERIESLERLLEAKESEASVYYDSRPR